MRFAGCAPAWRPGETGKKPSCLVVLDGRGGLISNSFPGDARQIAEAVAEHAAEGILVGIDAPLAVPNERGIRPIERVLSRVSLPAYSASRRMFKGRPFAEDLLAELQRVGVEYTDYPLPGHEGCWAVEVNSAAALRVLALERSGEKNGGLDRRIREAPELRYRKGNKEGRAAALREAISILWDTPGLRLRTGGLTDDLGSEENVDLSRLEVTPQLSHAELDRIVGLVEATLAAYTVHRHWRGRDGSMVVGSGREGAVMLPAGRELYSLVAAGCREEGIPYV
ncbi:hypothetical protein Rxycam_01092 [Rubrobacter xylanophilus DSM 9941]|uniref:DUF429 domain-containing protein n=1 Tax=Rubrobacter xylanophilus TaxID=49319 RepID=UPI001C63ED33|nr:DUF429 domain-containing protein [Rubrobacter xylanophilus]QYJ15277.1 hypothetical protein Rxycam_01092 [Rubrobacter xylanophilus DSM 9941]